MPFLAKLDLDAGRDARRARRVFAHRLEGLIAGRDRRFEAIIHNISETGFLAEFTSELQVGDELGLNVARLGFVGARVVWKRGLGHGCEFIEPVPFDVVEETVAASVRLGTDRGAGVVDEPQSATIDRYGPVRHAGGESRGRITLIACVLLAVLILGAALARLFMA